MSAMMYPVVLLFLAIAVLIFLLVFFIPRFQNALRGASTRRLPHDHPDHRRQSAIVVRQLRASISRSASVVAGLTWGARGLPRRASRRLWESWVLARPRSSGPLALADRHGPFLPHCSARLLGGRRFAHQRSFRRPPFARKPER